MLKQLDDKYIADIAAMHRLAFPDSAWTKLGGRIVEEYYLWHLTGPHPVVRATGVFMDGEFAGFCISGVFHASISGFLARNLDRLMMRLALRPWLVLDPAFFGKLKSGRKIMKRFKSKNRDRTQPTAAAAADSFGILAIAVDPRRQGLGLGQLLMDDAEKAAIELDFRKMDLTVNPTNVNAIRFYEKQNWVKLRVNDTWKGVMIKTLNRPVNSGSQ